MCRMNRDCKCTTTWIEYAGAQGTCFTCPNKLPNYTLKSSEIKALGWRPYHYGWQCPKCTVDPTKQPIVRTQEYTEIDN